MPAHYIREYGAGEIVKGLHLPHKIGIVGGKPGEQLVYVVPGALFQQEVHILREAVIAHILHRARKPAGDELALLVQVYAVLALHEGN